MSRVSIAGHSLGAHIAGLTGKRTQATGSRIQVIWGLGTKIRSLLDLIIKQDLLLIVYRSSWATFQHE